MEEQNQESTIVQETGDRRQETGVNKLGFLRNKKIVLVGVIVFVLVLIFITTLISGRVSKNNSSVSPSPTVNLTSPEAAVYFEPTTLNTVPGKSQTVDVFVNTWGREISGANIAISYNPNVISNVSLTQFRDKNSTVSLAFMPTSSTNNTTTGIIVLPLQMAPTTPMQKGKGKVATLTFTPLNSNITKTTLSFSLGTALISREGGKVIVLQKSNLLINYPINGVFPTEAPVIYK